MVEYLILLFVDHMSSSFSGLTGFNVTSPCSENAILSYSQSTPDMALLSTSTPTSTRPKMVKDWTPLSTGAGTNFLNRYLVCLSDDNLAVAFSIVIND